MKKIFIFVFFSFYVMANPSSPKIIHGKAEFFKKDNFLQVNSSDKTIIHWKNFSVDANEITKFCLPNAKSSILNKVIGKDISKIHGRLESNGIVYLINEKGIFIDKGAVIDVGGFIASTLNLKDAEFLNNTSSLHFLGNTKSSITNLGKISTDNGDIYLLGYSIENKGKISSKKGNVSLAAGKDILLQPEKEKKIAIKVSINPEKEGVGILQEGNIEAVKVDLKADGNLYRYAIKNKRKIQSCGIKEEGGRVFLTSEEGLIFHSGEITAKNNDGTGGQVSLIGEDVRVYDEAVIDVSGKEGGGKVFIGDKDTQHTLLEKDISIFANAEVKNDGGEVIILGNKACSNEGFISVEGGNLNGDGGLVEISGNGILHPGGVILRKAPCGKNGVLYIDPISITVSTAADANVAWVPGNFAFEASPAASTSGTLNITTMLNQLALGNVTVDATSGTGLGVGDITVNNPVAIVNTHDGNTLTFKAYNNFTLNDAITVTGSSANIVIATGYDGGGAVNIATTGSITYDSSSTGDLTIVAQGTGTGDITLTGPAAPSKVLSFKSSGICHISTKGETINTITYLEGDNITFNGDIEVENGQFIVRAADLLDINDPIDLTGTAAHELTSNTDSVYIDDFVTLNGSGSASLTISAYNLVNVNQDITINGTGSLNITSTNNDITINDPIIMNSTGTLTLSAGDDINIYDSITNINASSGNISVTVTGDLNINGISTNLPARIGSVAGTMSFTVGGNFILSGGDTIGSYAQVGMKDYDSTAAITINSVGGNLILQGGTTAGATSCYALIGHGSGTSASSTHVYGGNITISNIDGDLSLYGGFESNCFAQIGHTRGINNKVTNSGNISVSEVAKGIELIGGTAQGTYALIGHGGGVASTEDTYSGSVSVSLASTSSSNIFLLSGTQLQSFSGIGHIGYINSVGTITINNVPEIKVDSNNSLELRIRSYSEAFVGARVIGSGGGVGDISVTNVNIITRNSGNLTLTNSSTTADYKGGVIGVLANTDSTFPISYAGTAVSNLSLTISGSFNCITGVPLTGAEVYEYITNYSGTPNGTSTLSMTFSTGVMQAGKGAIVISSAGPLTMVGGSMIMINTFSTNTDQVSAIEANGTSTLTFGSLSMEGNISGPSSYIKNSSGNLNLTTYGDLSLDSNAYIENLGATNSFTLNVGSGIGQSGALDISNESYIKNQGTGVFTVNTGSSCSIDSALGGDSSLISGGPLTCSITENLVLLGGDTGTGKITSNGNTTISAEAFLLAGKSSHLASITNTSGYLTIASNDGITLSECSNIQVTTGSSSLQITGSDIRVLNQSFISHGGTGDISITSSNNVSFISGNLGGSYISSSGGEVNISATDSVLFSDLEGGNAYISAAGNVNVSGFNVAIAGETSSNVAYFQTSSGDITIIAQNDLTLVGDAYINNIGSDIILVIDQQAPSSPSVGAGSFILDRNCILTGLGKIRIFTAKPSQNCVYGTLNGESLVGVVTNQVYDTYYNTYLGDLGDPFTIFYKISGVSNSDLKVIAMNISEFNDKIDALFDLAPPLTQSFSLSISNVSIKDENIYIPTYTEYPKLTYPVFFNKYIGPFSEYDKLFLGD